MEKANALEFDLVIHLAGEQSIPNYMGMRILKAPQHLLVVTEKTKRQETVLRNVLAEFVPECPEVRSVVVPSAEADEIAKGVEREIDGFLGECPEARIAVNVTGGTKMMSLAAFEVAVRRGLTGFYIDTENKKLNRLIGEDFQAMTLPPVFSTVKEFVMLSNYELASEGLTAGELLTPARRKFLEAAWNELPVMKAVMDDFAMVNRRGLKSAEREGQCQIAMEKFSALSKADAGAGAYETWSNCQKEFGKYREAAKFLGGLWIEQWLLMRFADSPSAGKFIDLRNGVSISPPPKKNGKKSSPLQEIDLAFTDGYNLYQIECKGPAVEQGFIHKMESNRKGIGGVFGVGMITSLEFPEDAQKVEALKERVNDSTLSFIYAEALPDLPQHVFELKRKCWYRSNADWSAKPTA